MEPHKKQVNILLGNGQDLLFSYMIWANALYGAAKTAADLMDWKWVRSHAHSVLFSSRNCAFC